MFVQWMRQRALHYPPTYADHSLNMKPRELKIYDIVCPQHLERDVVADLKYFESQACKLLQARKLMKVAKILLRSKFPLEPVDEDIKPRTRAEIGNTVIDGKPWWAHVTILGKVKDGMHPEDGYEMI